MERGEKKPGDSRAGDNVTGKEIGEKSMRHRREGAASSHRRGLIKGGGEERGTAHCVTINQGTKRVN